MGHLKVIVDHEKIDYSGPFKAADLFNMIENFFLCFFGLPIFNSYTHGQNLLSNSCPFVISKRHIYCSNFCAFYYIIKYIL